MLWRTGVYLIKADYEEEINDLIEYVKYILLGNLTPLTATDIVS